jgi:two-component system, LytTR family, response regulator
MKINCVILDDEPENLKYLQQITEDIKDVVIVKSFSDATSFLKEIVNIQFDMCILDNHLPDGTGIEVAKTLRNKKIIFVSAHDIDAYEAFDLNAIDVIKKPVSKQRLQEAIKKCRNKIINEKGFVFFNTNEGIRKFKWEEIVYITTEDRSQSKSIITKDEKVKTSKLDFDKMLSKLPDNLFCQVHKSFLLNTQYFKSLINNETIVLNHKENNISKKIETGGKYVNQLKRMVGLENTD